MHLDIREEVNHVAQTTFVQLRTRVVARENTLQIQVLALYELQGIVDCLANLRGVRLFQNITPSGTLGNKENAAFLRAFVFVLVLRVGVFVLLKFLVLGLELVADVFQEDKPQNHTFILRRTQVAAQLVRSPPNGLFKPYGCCVLCLLCHISFPFIILKNSRAPRSDYTFLRCKYRQFNSKFKIYKFKMSEKMKN